MKDNRTKELVMKNIREALIDKNEVADCEAQPAPGTTFVQDDHDDLSVLFAKNFTRAGGTLFYCYNEADIGKRILEIQHQHSDTPIACLSENLTNFISHLGVNNCHTTSPTNQSNLGASLCEALLAWQGSIVALPTSDSASHSHRFPTRPSFWLSPRKWSQTGKSQTNA